jgi:hypothetical protein
MGVLEKIKEIEAEMARTQKNKVCPMIADPLVSDRRFGISHSQLQNNH